VLLLLAFLMLLRCVLDPFDIGYYHLPFLLALLGWETLTSDRPPVLSLTAAVVVWFTFEQVPQHLPADGQALSYLAWAVPLVVVIARRLYRAPAPAAVPRGAPVPAAA
jgi:hypothetical protein